VAHTASAKKRIRQSGYRRALNRWRKGNVKDVVRDFELAVKGGDKQQAQQALDACYKQLDRVAAKGSIHKNAASRKKSRLAKRLANMD
jgi:small subunit ribosomal protein S20